MNYTPNLDAESMYLRQNKFYIPDKMNMPVFVIGCGSLGGNIAVALAKMGLTDFILFDPDTVEQHNIPNQPFCMDDIGDAKVDAVGIYIEYSSLGSNIKKNKCEWRPGDTIPEGSLIINTPDCINVRKEVFINAPADAFIIDARSGPESYDVHFCDMKDPKHVAFYGTTFFEKENAVNEGCGAQSTVFGSLDVTAVATNGFMRWRNRKPIPVHVMGHLMTLDREQLYL